MLTLTQYWCCSREYLWVVVDFRRHYRNIQNEWMVLPLIIIMIAIMLIILSMLIIIILIIMIIFWAWSSRLWSPAVCCWCLQLLLFCEGTRFTEAKHQLSMEVAKQKGLPLLHHHLLPRTKGFIQSMHGLKGKGTSLCWYGNRIHDYNCQSEMGVAWLDIASQSFASILALSCLGHILNSWMWGHFTARLITGPWGP